jgi:hypothetical protein
LIEPSVRSGFYQCADGASTRRRIRFHQQAHTGAVLADYAEWLADQPLYARARGVPGGRDRVRRVA